MIDILSTAQNLLRDADFRTHLVALDRTALICFEDDAFLGFCSVFESPSDLIEGWKTRETAVLTRFAPQFRSAGDKAWNVYSVFLCQADGDEAQNRQMRWIEEDLERTRKIAGCGITSRDDIVQILLPVMPLQYQPALEAQDVLLRLKSRIASISPRAADVVLDDGVQVTEVVRLMGEIP